MTDKTTKAKTTKAKPHDGLVECRVLRNGAGRISTGECLDKAAIGVSDGKGGVDKTFPAGDVFRCAPETGYALEDRGFVEVTEDLPDAGEG